MSTVPVLAKVILVLMLMLSAMVNVVHKLALPSFLGREQPPAAEKLGALSRPAQGKASDATPSAPAIDHTAQVIVLGYHRFVDKVRRPDTEITPAEFEAQMQALKDHGITVISLDDFFAWRRGEKNIPAQSALLTIDDGYNVAYATAWPILKKYGYPFTMFIYTDYVHGGPKSGGGSMTWEQLAEMRDAGVSIQSHTVSHPDLRRKKPGASEASYDEWLWNELNGSREIIEQRLGIHITALALPYGLANDHVREVAAKAGYEMVFTVNGQKVDFDTPMQTLGRYMVQGNQPKLFQTATTFSNHRESPNPATATADTFAHLRPLPSSPGTPTPPTGNTAH